MKWEYISININAGGVYAKNLDEKKTVEKLNELGNDCWELVAIVPITSAGFFSNKTQTNAFAFLLKRPVIK
ncbi:MAG: hypothetical protein UT12_C0009G0035 [Candidatus Curtissbacteria bacterium GW2011_GWC2_38_9]|uniref:DUF4177 domain-containing protein n=3 Tax=Candidatus Curtissiibacteriota TaxID=1752717 RepID=A0A1F5HR81_9BACT|nr:MAG: hypothetical protein UT12_C0009G0035 [Candidatus Curtissbacteria bacterium GW2011_GWC2_38_9]KKS03896.1 MAG: hypothetical protein UU56_C0013G0033 [Candidatus Curtissbacteria bacterium GW2011_GWA2_41_24]OGD89228.1 MAG: hypothetical protein A2Z54_00630 [Candidatus Curtissbacteria bacterium RIFCSPHIGHO2_02_39_8]OGE06677.1 MAG: hypothetical protein A2W70_04450 [Candidatus Curtissbacteria bacterium RIFCSPLOWO2_02_41_11]